VRRGALAPWEGRPFSVPKPRFTPSRSRDISHPSGSLVHGSSVNVGPDRRFLLLVEMVPTWASPPRARESAMLLRGADTHGTFDDEPRPDGEWTETALANWERVAAARGRRLFHDSRLAPSEAYGGVRPAT
jgi:hypothetical protein